MQQSKLPPRPPSPPGRPFVGLEAGRLDETIPPSAAAATSEFSVVAAYHSPNKPPPRPTVGG